MPLADRIQAAPLAHDAALAERNFTDLKLKAARLELGELAAFLERETAASQLLQGIFGCSPFLTRIILAAPHELWACLTSEPGAYLRSSETTLAEALTTARRHEEAMKPLREAKKRLALCTALADLGGVWTVEQVTDALSRGADMLLQASIRFLLAEAAQKGKLTISNEEAPEEESGYIVLAMGKHGAYELNYSSDIDLIVFYDGERIRLGPDVEPAPFFVRLTRDLVKLMAERTSDGYVFRTDLRLRPDPGATQIALSVNAGLHYYETVGQNWERAAYIKARPAAGDIPAGLDFLRELSPYIWRKYLDYAAIADIHAMKRQIHAHKGHMQIAVEGHNLKLGRGGIREIEFFVQTQQLIAGGRQDDLRVRGTLQALNRLAERGWIAAQTAKEMAEAYRFLRSLEHRLQMIDDEQTHSLPPAGDKFEKVAHFAGYEDGAALGKALRQRLETVQRHYAALFENVPELSRSDAPGSLVFTGDGDDPATVQTLADMGFSSPSAVIAAVKSWHFGRYRAVRTSRARERLTEFTPHLLQALAATSQPDLALATFDRFLAELPVGVQLFALLRSNPELLGLLADIMGTAPRLARIVGHRPRLMDAVLDPGVLGELPPPDALHEMIRSRMEASRSYEESLDLARIIGREQQFLIGVRVLSGAISAEQAGGAYATLASQLISLLHDQTERQIARQHGHVGGGEMAVLAMGKLGGGEMAATSDLDLIMIYRYDASQTISGGLKPVSPSQYYARATQRLISALSARTSEGGLYEVDMRLRPSGKSGPVATSLPAFVAYQTSDAWTWEHMALTRARVISGPEGLKNEIEKTIQNVLCTFRNSEKTSENVRSMREKIAQEKGSKDVWELKYVDGGLVDVEFITQYLQLIHAHDHPQVLDQNTVAALQKLRDAGALSAADADIVLPAAHLYHSLTQIMRLCLDGPFDPVRAPEGLRAMLSRAADVSDFSLVEPRLRDTQNAVAACFAKLVQ